MNFVVGWFKLCTHFKIEIKFRSFCAVSQKSILGVRLCETSESLMQLQTASNHANFVQCSQIPNLNKNAVPIFIHWFLRKEFTMHYHLHISRLYNWDCGSNMNISADQGIPCHVFGTMYSFVNVKNQSKLYIHLIFVFVFNCILSVPTILLNAVSIIAILKSHRLKSMPCYFIIYVQSIIDLAVGILAIPLFLFFITSEIWQLSSCVAGEMVVRLLFTLLGSYLLSCIPIFT